MEEEIVLKSRFYNNLVGPEGVLMLSLAFGFDLIEIIANLVPVAGDSISLAIDVLAFIFIGGWLILRGEFWRRITKRRKLRMLKSLMILAEILPIPFIGDLPFWTIIVFTELRNS